LDGLLGTEQRKTGWMRAEAAGDPGPWRQQAILGRGRWDAKALRNVVRDYVVEHLADDDAVLVIDETGFLKQGKASCGVNRQYTGSAGKITNCQIGIFASYVSRHGHAFIDRALYLPKVWTDDPARLSIDRGRVGCGIEPRDVEDREGREGSRSRRQHVRHRHARWCRFAEVEGRITHEQHASEHERPDRGRRIGLRRGMEARRCRSRHPSRGRESDWFVVPMTPSKETRRVEGRGQPGRIPGEREKGRTRSRVTLPSGLARVNATARGAVQTRFTALLHHVDVEALERAFWRQKRRASAGVDGITVDDYERDLEDNLRDLCARVHTGRYRPHPVRRVFIPKADGGRRPLGVPTLEDKIVQGAVAEVLSTIYEADFLGFSYGFRPGRNPHQALSSLHTAIMSQRVNWVLDADIRSFLDSAS